MPPLGSNCGSPLGAPDCNCSGGVGGCFQCITNIETPLVTDTTADKQPLTGLITIPANTLQIGSGFFSQFAAWVQHLGTSIANKTGFLSLILDGNLAVPISFQSVTFTTLTTQHTFVNAGIGGFIFDILPGNAWIFSVALGDIKSGASVGFSGNARWSMTNLSPGGFGIGEGSWFSMGLDLTLPHTLQWFWNWTQADNNASVLQGLVNKVYITK